MEPIPAFSGRTRPPSPGKKVGPLDLLKCCGAKSPRPYQQLEQPESDSSFCTAQRAAVASALVLLLGASVAFAFVVSPGMLGQGGGADSATTNGVAALTSLTEDHPAGAKAIQVESSHGFEVGDVITISHPADGGYSEEREIVDMGSIILNKPLEHQYPIGSKVRKNVLTAGEETARPARPAEAVTSEPAEDRTSAPTTISTPEPSDEPTPKPTDDTTTASTPKPTPKEKAVNVDSKQHGPGVISFYLYRAAGDTDYPLENVNVGDLAGVLWYLHNEIVGAPVRKYSIDRIKRYKIKMKPVVEFWNVHHTNFGPFMAYDAARCSTPACKEVYGLYGYILGCQPVTPGRSGYEAMEDTMSKKACAPKDISCRSPMWYSLPGPCPLKKISSETIKEQTKDHGIENQVDKHLVANSEDEAKDDECKAAEPGGRCEGEPTGAPDCVYSVEDAGEVSIDELVGTLPSFSEWFKDHKTTREYDENTDKGIGVTFWDGRDDPEKCMDRLTQVLAKFDQMHGVDEDLTAGQPICDFDGWYDGEFDWPRNHTGGVQPSRGFTWDDGETLI
jgi:hypothetical protein